MTQRASTPVVRPLPKSSTFLFAVVLVGACAGGQALPTAGQARPTGGPTAAAPSSTTAPVSIAPSPSITPAPAADGQIVFEDAGVDYRHTQIWIENADGSNVRKVVSDDATDNSASLSRDGQRVAFYRDSGDALGGIMIVNVDGSGLHELDTGSRAEGCDAAAEGDSWSPDGDRLVFTRTCFVNGDYVSGYLGQGLWTINVDGTDLRPVTTNAAPTSCPAPEYCVHVEDHRASWAPDGKGLVFERIDTSTTPERSAIFTIGIDGRGLSQVTVWKLDANDPDWSPDGTLIVFNSPAESGGDQNIWTIHPDGTGLTQLTSGLTAYADGGQATFHPSWSPDGTKILFTHAPSSADGSADLFVMNWDGSDLHVLAKTELHENHAFWGSSPQP